jgi:hypothetical protein
VSCGFCARQLAGPLPALARASVVLLSPASGLIGSPELGSPDHSGLPSVLKAKSLLIARVQPGDRVNIESAHVSGFFQVMKVVHTGDSASPTSWHTDYELRPLTNAK